MQPPSALHRSRLAPLLASAVLLTLAACGDDAVAPVGPAATAVTPDLAVTSGALAFRQVAAGWQHTCGVTTGNVAYCWGDNLDGQLGDGTFTRRLRPVKVAGGLRFLEVRAGENHTCGLTTDSLAYCWGRQEWGQLGDGHSQFGEKRPTPTIVLGGRRWRQVSAGSSYTCGITSGGVAFCWGRNRWGQLGVSGVNYSASPLRVAGSLKFRRVLTAFSHTCGATTSDRGYCWGVALGFAPVAVTGGLSFRQVLPGAGFIARTGSDPGPDYIYTCGVTTADRLYCWVPGSTPTVPVDTRRWLYVNPGGLHTCGLSLIGKAFCWGSNPDGQLGIGGAAFATAPTAVAGGYTFNGLSTYVLGRYTCGVTTDHLAYCWGDNSAGQLGDGTQFINRTTPVAVVGPS